MVKLNNDLWKYTLILSLSTLISQLYLWLFIRKEVKYEKVSVKEIFSHLKKCLILFIPVIAYSVYRIMDKTMIGYFSNTFQLGNYENAEKIITIPISFITALGTVMLPHMAKTDDYSFSKKITDSFKLCFFMLFPISVCLLVIADDFSTVFFGNEFIYSANLIKILIITVLFSGVTNVVRTNYLIPKSKDRVYVISTIYGALVNFVLNIIFIKKYGAYGACIGTIAAEMIVMLYQIEKTRSNIEYYNNIKSVIPFLVKSVIMGIIIYLVNYFNISNILIKVSIQVLLGVIIYFSLNKNYIINDFFGKKN